MQETNWQDIYSTFSPKLLGICRRYIKDLATAEDIVQDSFIVAIQKESVLKNKEALKGWLCKIVINRAINHLKSEKKISSTSSENFEFIDDSTDMYTLEINKKSAILASDFSHEDLLEAIDSLSENHKTVFNLYIIDQFSHLEISELLKISVGTSKSSLSRARKNIQQFLIDKLNNNKTDEKKKRRIAVLLFFGFGNQLFANYYRNSFSTFEIKPKNELNFTRKVKPFNDTFSIKSSHFSIYKKAGIFVFSLLLLLFLLQNEEEQPVKKVNHPNVKERKIVISSLDSSTFENITEKSIKIEDENKKQDGIQITKIQTKPVILESSIKKDTSTVTKEPPKIVVIKKQIIIKDTVYVEN